MPVDGIVADRVSEVLHMYTNLMRATSDGFAPDDTCVGMCVVGQTVEDGLALLSKRVHYIYTRLPIHGKYRLSAFDGFASWKLAAHPAHVVLANLARGKDVRELARGLFASCTDHDTGSQTVKSICSVDGLDPMVAFKHFNEGRFEVPASGMYRYAARLDDDEVTHFFISVQNLDRLSCDSWLMAMNAIDDDVAVFDELSGRCLEAVDGAHASVDRPDVVFLGPVTELRSEDFQQLSSQPALLSKSSVVVPVRLLLSEPEA